MLFKLQIVCKDWNALPTLKEYFCNLHIDNHIQASYFLRFRNAKLKNGALYNLDNKKFVKMNFTFVVDAIRKVENNTNLGSSNIRVLWAVSSGGLLYMTLSSNLNKPHAFICKPLTKACKCISQQRDKSSNLSNRSLVMGEYAGFSFQRDNFNNYIIFTCDEQEDRIEFWYYEASTSKWRVAGNLESTFFNINLRWFEFSGIIYEDVCYILFKDGAQHCIIGYDFKNHR